MQRRLSSLMVAIALLTAGAVAIATNVQGQDFERQAVADGTNAYKIDWESPDPGMLRLALSPSEEATHSEATVSLVEDQEVQGTYTLDDDWPRLDVHVEPNDEPTVFVHETLGAEIDVLAEEGHSMDWKPTQVTTGETLLASGDRETVRTQVALQNDEAPLHLDLRLEGAVEDLNLEASQDDETVLEATVEQADTNEDDALAPTVHPEALQAGDLLVKIDAAELDGNLFLTEHTLQQDRPHVIQEDDVEDEEDTGETTNDTDQDASADVSTLDEVRNVTPGGPTGITAPEEASLHLASEDDDARLILFAPNDTVQDVLSFDEEAPEQAPSETSEDLAWTSLPTDLSGEHVLVLDAHHTATLYADDEEKVDDRGLDRIELQGEVSPEGSTLSTGSYANQTKAVEGGLFGFSWDSQGADVDREVSLEGPNGETLYESHALAADRFQLGHYDANDPLVGPAGEYTVHTDSTSLYDEGIEFTMTIYER